MFLLFAIDPHSSFTAVVVRMTKSAAAAFRIIVGLSSVLLLYRALAQTKAWSKSYLSNPRSEGGGFCRSAGWENDFGVYCELGVSFEHLK